MNNKIKNLIAWYSIVVGICILIMRPFILLNEPINEGEKEMLFHLISELILAVLCIYGGLIYWKKDLPFVTIAAHSMLIYSVLNAAGFYFEKAEHLMVFIFVLLFIISIIVLIKIFSQIKTKFN